RRVAAALLPLDGLVAPAAIEAPAMIGADKLAGMAAGGMGDSCALVRAAVDETAQHPVTAAHDQRRHAAHIDREKIMRPRRLAFQPQEQPAALKDVPHLQLEEIGIVEHGAVDAEDALVRAIVDEGTKARHAA